MEEGGWGGVPYLHAQVQPVGIDAGLNSGVVRDHVRGHIPPCIAGPLAGLAHALQQGQGLRIRLDITALLLRSQLNGFWRRACEGSSGR